MTSRVRDRHLNIRLTQKERDLIIRAATRENRTAANWARLVLLAACEEEEAAQDEGRETP